MCALTVLCLTVTACYTTTFQNIDTHGTASDLVDDTQSAEPVFSPTVDIPLK